LQAQVERVWALLTAVEDWPLWWRAVQRVEVLEKGDEQGVGALRHMTWKTALPYSLTFSMRTTRIEQMHCIEGSASGELEGRGIWTLHPDGSGTQARYDWTVDVTRPWMRLTAPLLQPVFAWNHGVVMGWGEQDIRRRLAAWGQCRLKFERASGKCAPKSTKPAGESWQAAQWHPYCGIPVHNLGPYCSMPE
jgi:uncharacterized protein YndB with AHSA1/START domain